MAAKKSKSNSNKKSPNTNQNLKNNMRMTKKTANPLITEVSSWVLVAVGAFVLLSVLTLGNLAGQFGALTNKILRGLFGFGAVFLPLGMMGGGIYSLIVRSYENIRRLRLYAIILFILTICFTHVLNLKEQPVYPDFISYMKANFDGGNLSNGGLLGALFGNFFDGVLGRIGAVLLLLVSMIVTAILMTGKSFAQALGKGFKLVGGKIGDMRATRAANQYYDDEFDAEDLSDFEPEPVKSAAPPKAPPAQKAPAPQPARNTAPNKSAPPKQAPPAKRATKQNGKRTVVLDIADTTPKSRERISLFHEDIKLNRPPNPILTPRPMQGGQAIPVPAPAPSEPVINTYIKEPLPDEGVNEDLNENLSDAFDTIKASEEQAMFKAARDGYTAPTDYVEQSRISVRGLVSDLEPDDFTEEPEPDIDDDISDPFDQDELDDQDYPDEQEYESYDDQDEQDELPIEEPPWNTARPEPASRKAATQPVSLRRRLTQPVPQRAVAASDTPIPDTTKSGALYPDYSDYKFPPIELLKKNTAVQAVGSRAEVLENSRKLEEILKSFRVEARVVEVSIGPTVTRYELAPGQGVKVSAIANLSNDLALGLAAQGIRIEAPIPGKSAVGIEIPNRETQPVLLREILEDDAFVNFPSKLAFGAGKDIAGKTVIGDVAKMPHLLIAGATGAGKSVCINTLVTSILYKARPDEVKLLMIDPKVVELSVYNGIPHLMIPVVTDPKKAAGALNWAVAEMDNRYVLFAQSGVRDLKGYNAILTENGEKQILPQIVIIIDELADLMMVSKGEVEEAICRIAQKARAAGIHLIVATQRPSVDVITGLIKANIPSRLAFAVSSGTDSRTVLDMTGAEKLLGKGDMLFLPVGMNKPVRVQCGFISEKEVENIVSFLKMHHQVVYDEETVERVTEPGNFTSDSDDEEYFDEAVEFLIRKQKASTSLLQRQFRIGYNRASRLMDVLEAKGIVGPEDGSKPRRVLVTMEEWRSRA